MDCIAYYRVSTDRQGRSGLGLEAQQQTVTHYLRGINGHLLAEYTEVESGKRNDRPELQAALDHCRKAKATLIIAKLDRLGRNVAFIASLMEGRTDFICCDNPHANRLMLHMLAAFAEHEREQISVRTREALAAVKRRGKKLGNPRINELAGRNREDAVNHAETLRPVISEFREAGINTARSIAEALNARNTPTARGWGKWQLATTHKLLKRLDAVESPALRIAGTVAA